jgi:hypothetical protein
MSGCGDLTPFPLSVDGEEEGEGGRRVAGLPGVVIERKALLVVCLVWIRDDPEAVLAHHSLVRRATNVQRSPASPDQRKFSRWNVTKGEQELVRGEQRDIEGLISLAGGDVPMPLKIGVIPDCGRHGRRQY